MFNLLIADDEELERRAIKSILNDKFCNEFNIYEARNGREAIEIGDKVKPDIVIMDIKMPGINGIEAIKEMKKSLKDTYFIILSAYDYFNYAKEAMAYEVREYMLKPLKRGEFVEKILKAKEHIEEIKLKRSREIELMEKICTLMPVLEDELCYSIITNNLNNIDYRSYLKILNIKFEAGYSFAINIKEKYAYLNMNEAQRKEVKAIIKDYIKEYLSNSYNLICSCLFTKEIVGFVEVSKEHNDYEMRVNSISLLRRLADIIKEKFDVSILIGIGKIYCGIENFGKSYNEALISLNHDSPDMRVKHFEDISAAKLINAGSQKNLVSKAIEYIKSNYNKDITLDEVASFVCSSSYYFSKIFKEFTGKNYVDYITELRIQKAKEMLLRGNLSIKEICFEVGYNDPNYFSRVFKKIEGVSPTEFKGKNAI
jgi:two-component system response regulator YesN